MRKTTTTISNLKCWRLLNELVFGTKLECPICGTRMRENYTNRYVWCGVCRRKYRATAYKGQWLYGMKLSPRQFFIVAWCWQHRVPLATAQLLSHVSHTTIRRWYARLDTTCAMHSPLLDRLLDEIEGEWIG